MVRVGVRRGDLKRWSGHHAPAYPSPRPPQGRAKKAQNGERGWGSCHEKFARAEIRRARRGGGGERERGVGVERGKEAVNEDAKARSARAQK